MAKDLIHSDPAIMMGKPVIKGTRITVELVLEKLAAGETVETLLKSYPHLKKEGIRAAIAYASKVMKMDVVHPVSYKAA